MTDLTNQPIVSIIDRKFDVCGNITACKATKD